MSCESECSTGSKSCQTHDQPCHDHESSCGSQSSCPIEKKIEKWQKSFCEAMHGAMVDILKEKIKARWGEKLSIEADAIINSKESQWHSLLAQAKAKAEFHEEIKKVILG